MSSSFINHNYEKNICSNLEVNRGGGIQSNSMSSPQNGDFTVLVESMHQKRRNLTRARSDLAATLVQLGEYHVRNKEYDDAMSAFTEALEEQKSTQLTMPRPQSCSSISDSLYHQSMNRKSLDQKSMYLSEMNDNDETITLNNIVSTLSSIGNVHSLRGEHDAAMKYFGEVMSIRASQSNLSSKDAISTSCSGSSLSGIGWNEEEDTSTVVTDLNEDVQALDDLFQRITFQNSESGIASPFRSAKNEDHRESEYSCECSSNQQELKETGAHYIEGRDELDLESSTRKDATASQLHNYLHDVSGTLKLYRTALRKYSGNELDAHNRNLQEFIIKLNNLEVNVVQHENKRDKSELREKCLNCALEICDQILVVYREIKLVESSEPSKHSHDQTSLQIASTLITMGTLHYKLGNIENELNMYGEALTTYIDTLGENHKYVAGTRKNIGMVLAELEDFDEAMEQFQNARSTYAALNGGSDMSKDVASTLSCMGNVQDRRGNLDEALTFYDEALYIQRKLAEDVSWSTQSIQDVILTLKAMGMVYTKKSNKDSAMECYKEAEHLLRDSNHHIRGKIGVLLASVLTRIGSLLSRNGQYDEAMESYHEAYEIATKALKTEVHQDVAGILYYMASVLQKRGSYDEAMECYKKCVSIYYSTLGHENSFVATTFVCIGSIHYKKQNFNQAMRFYKAALKLYENLYGPFHPDIAPTLKSIAMIHTKKYEYAEAMDLFVEILRMKCVAMGANHPDVANAYRSIGNLHYKKGEYNDAEKQYRHALSIYKRAFGVDHVDTLSIQKTIDTVRRRIGRDGKSRKRRNISSRGGDKRRVSRNVREI